MMLLLMVAFLFSLTLGASASKEIVINIPEFRLYLYENGVPLKQYRIGVGNVLNPSILGYTEIINRVENPTYYPPRWWERGLEPIPPGPNNPVGTRWLGLGFPGYGIHGTNNPDSIGKAMSAGCIRMLNSDVEELTELVDIGTPVKLIYETVILYQDPLISSKLITIHPDIYKLGSNSLEKVASKIKERGWGNYHLPGLERIVKEAAATAQPIPFAVPIKKQGEILDLKAIQIGNTYYVPFEKEIYEAELSKKPKIAFSIDHDYVKLNELADLYLLSYQVSDAIEITVPQVYVDNLYLGRAIILNNGEILIPVNEIASLLDISIEWLEDEGLVLIDGHYGVEALEFGDQLFVPEWVINWIMPGGKVQIK